MTQSASVMTGQTAGVWQADTGFGRLNVYDAVKLAQKMTELQGSDIVSAFKLLLNPVSQLNLKSFNEPVMGEVGVGADRWADQDGSHWLTVADVYGH